MTTKQKLKKAFIDKDTDPKTNYLTGYGLGTAITASIWATSDSELNPWVFYVAGLALIIGVGINNYLGLKDK